MKIKFLGTSAGWPLPRLGCECEICTSKNPKDTRTRTQLLVNQSILIDAGPDTYNHLKKENPRKIRAILLSHTHTDHIIGFHDLTHVYNAYKPIPIHVPSVLVPEIRRSMGPRNQNLKINVVKPNEPFTVENVKVEYFPVIHGKTPAFGIKLKESKIFIYITDFSRILPAQVRTVKHADMWAIDGSTLGKTGQGQGHISITDGIRISKELKIKETYFIHIGHKTGTHRFLENHLVQKAGKNFHISYDGLEINI